MQTFSGYPRRREFKRTDRLGLPLSEQYHRQTMPVSGRTIRLHMLITNGAGMGSKLLAGCGKNRLTGNVFFSWAVVFAPGIESRLACDERY